jgi:ABC-type multidrug transport system fused ATPase/permease subunit
MGKSRIGRPTGNLTKLANHLSPRRKRQLGMLLGLMVASAFAEVLSLGAVLPFIGVLTAPETVLDNSLLNGVSRVFGISDAGQVMVAVTLFFCATAVVAGVVRVLQIRASTRLAYAIGADLGIEIYRRTLYQPYEVHKSRNSSEVVAGVTRKVDGVVTGTIVPVLTLISSTILFVTILAGLLVIDWRTALAAAGIFGTAYIVVTLFARRRLRANGAHVAREQTNVLRALNEGLNGIRDVLLNGTQDYYAQIYRRSDIALRRAQGTNLFLAQAPRYGMEAAGMVMIALLALSLVRGSGAETALPVLAAMALGGQRMLPALQQGYAALSTVIGYRATLSDAIELLEQPLPARLGQAAELVTFNDRISFEEVDFGYRQMAEPVLKGLSLTIPKGARVGFVGPTGSGKSTAIDLLMGLLAPTAGTISVDGNPIHEFNVRAWQAHIAHVPQSIYLADGSFAENIALGEAADSIDMARVRDAAERAQIHEFIQSCPQGYQTSAGENGARLSGGQKQRIGIARALYRRASLIVLDEATSALDSATEKAVIEAVENLDPNITVVMIAHRLSTLSNCSVIFELDGGRVSRTGSFEQILAEPEGSG